MRDVKNHVFQNLRPVRALNQSREFSADFVLTLTRHFMVMYLNWYAKLLKQQTHFRTHVHECISRCYWEITAFGTGTMTQIAAFGFV